MKQYFIWQKNYLDGLRDRLPEYRFRPHTERFLLDLIYILFLLALENSIFRSLSGPYRLVDLVTPWFCISVLQKRPIAVFGLCVWVGFIKEVQSSIPSGAYFCAYWIIANLIVQVRPALSWRYYSPWLAMFVFSSLIVFLFEYILVAYRTGLTFYWTDIAVTVVRMTISILFGMYMCRSWLRFDAEEPLPL